MEAQLYVDMRLTHLVTISDWQPFVVLYLGNTVVWKSNGVKEVLTELGM